VSNTVCKFGGTSLASSEQFRKVAAIIKSDPNRKYIVASAPGKRASDDIKVTDLLNSCHSASEMGMDFRSYLDLVYRRFSDIIEDLQISSVDLRSEISIIEENLSGGCSRDYISSRGEYLNSKILAAFLGYEFIDTAGLVLFNEDGRFNPSATNKKLSSALADIQKAVIPGFYGSRADGSIQTFSRGGSDVTGSIVALAVNADLYENWTDVSGMLSADPRIVDDPETISRISYRELRELSYMGASVLHEDAVFPVREAGIPINIRNTNAPSEKGTLIMATPPGDSFERTVTGIAGKKGFSSILIEKSLMNNEIGFLSKLLEILASYNISIDHIPTGIDTISVVVHSSDFLPVKEQVLQDIFNALSPDSVSVEDNIALIAVVGHGMAQSPGTASKIFRAIASAGVNIRMIDQGSSEMNIILAVNEENYESSIQSIYKEFWN